MRAVAGLALLFLACGAVSAAPLPRYGVFYFSSYCIEKESDDAAGNRALLIRDGNGDRLFWEWSEGPMEGPVQAREVRIDRPGHIRFTVDQGSSYGIEIGTDGKHSLSQDPPDMHTYAGTISAQMLDLDGMRLPRVTNFAARTRQCR
jgi:hypothetical protein